MDIRDIKPQKRARMQGKRSQKHQNRKGEDSPAPGKDAKRERPSASSSGATIPNSVAAPVRSVAGPCPTRSDVRENKASRRQTPKLFRTNSLAQTRFVQSSRRPPSFFIGMPAPFPTARILPGRDPRNPCQIRPRHFFRRTPQNYLLPTILSPRQHHPQRTPSRQKLSGLLPFRPCQIS